MAKDKGKNNNQQQEQQKASKRPSYTFITYFSQETGIEPFMRESLDSRGNGVYHMYLRAFNHKNFNRDEQVFVKLNLVEGATVGRKLQELSQKLQTPAVVENLKKWFKSQPKGKKTHRQQLVYHQTENSVTVINFETYPRKNGIGSALVFFSKKGDEQKTVNVPLELGQLYHLGKIMENACTDISFARVRYYGGTQDQDITEQEQETMDAGSPPFDAMEGGQSDMEASDFPFEADGAEAGAEAESNEETPFDDVESEEEEAEDSEEPVAPPL